MSVFDYSKRELNQICENLYKEFPTIDDDTPIKDICQHYFDDFENMNNFQKNLFDKYFLKVADIEYLGDGIFTNKYIADTCYDATVRQIIKKNKAAGTNV